MEKILVPTDFSEEANNAVGAAALIARKFNVEILLLHVIEGPTNASFNVAGESSYGGNLEDIYVVKLLPIVKERLEKIKENYSDITINYEIEVGNASNAIIKTVTDKSCHMIVMGTRGISGLDEIFIGSNTEKVVRLAKCPVLSLKVPVDDSTFKNIVFATDMGPNQGSMVAELKDFQQAFDSTIHLLKVNTPNSFQADRVTRARMRDFVEEHSLENTTINIFNDAVEGDGIMYFAQEINAEMIAMATHGRTGLSHLLSGSIAEDIVNHAKRPVYTYNIR